MNHLKRLFVAILFLVGLSLTAGACEHHHPMVKESTIRALEPGTQYWWRVTDLDENGGTTVSDIRTFTTKGKRRR